MLQVPERSFYTLFDLKDHWPTKSSDIHHWLIHGDLLGSAWLPVMTVVEQSPDLADGGLPEFHHWEGFIQLSSHQCRRLFRNGRITMRAFNVFGEDQAYALPETSDDIIVDLDDLVILKQERERFESRYPSMLKGAGDTPPHKPVSSAVQEGFDPTYRSMRVGGQEYFFGDIQAKIIRLLAEAAKQGKPWQSGKLLLLGAGSQSYSLSNVFKRHPVWKTLIQSDRRGFYRLNEAFVN